MARLSLLWLLLLGARLSACASSATITSAPICEDSLDGGNTPPFQANAIPCLLGCGSQVVEATGSLLPGSVDESAIPYCELDCVVSSASPSQSAEAPACYDICGNVNGGNVENKGWCMYWCVAGYSDLVASTACVPSLVYVPVTSVMDGRTITYEREAFRSAARPLSMC